VESKGYAIAFLIVMVIICTGAYVAISALQANTSQPLVRIARPADTTNSSMATKVVSPTRQQATATVAPPTETPQPPITLPVQLTPTPVPGNRKPSVTSVPTATTVQSTATPVIRYPYVQDGPVSGDFSHACEGAYIYGIIRDARGNPLEGVHIQASDAWGNHLEAVSKGGTDRGRYDIPINSNIQNTWNVAIINPSGNSISAVVPVHHAGHYVPGKEPCWHRLDWRRAN